MNAALAAFLAGERPEPPFPPDDERAAAEHAARAVLGATADAALALSRELALASGMALRAERVLDGGRHWPAGRAGVDAALDAALALPDPDPDDPRLAALHRELAAGLAAPGLRRALDTAERQAAALIDRAVAQIDRGLVQRDYLAAALQDDRELPEDATVDTVAVAALLRGAAGGWRGSLSLGALAGLSLLLDDEAGTETGPVSRRGPLGALVVAWEGARVAARVGLWGMRLAARGAAFGLELVGQGMQPGENPAARRGSTMVHSIVGVVGRPLAPADAAGWRDFGMFLPVQLWVLLSFALGEGVLTAEAGRIHRQGWAAIWDALRVEGWVGAVMLPALLATLLGMRVGVRLFATRVEPLLSLAAGVALSALSTAPTNGSDLARWLWAAAKGFERAEQAHASGGTTEARPGRYGHALWAHHLLAVRWAFQIGDRESPAPVWELNGLVVPTLGWLNTAVQACAGAAREMVLAGTATAERVRPAGLVPVSGAIGAGLADLAGVGTMLSVALVLAATAAGIDERRDSVGAGRIALRMGIAVGASLVLYGATANWVAESLLGPAALAVLGRAGRTPDECYRLAADGLGVAIPPLAAAVALGVDERVATALRVLVARVRRKGGAGARQWASESGLFAGILGGRSEEQDERALYLGRAMAASRLIAGALVDVRAVEAALDAGGIDRAAALLGVRLDE